MRLARYLVQVAILLAPAAGQTTETVIPDALYRPGTPPVLQPAEADVLLRREGIVTSSRDGNLRISAHAYNSVEDVDAVLAALKRNRSLLA